MEDPLYEVEIRYSRWPWRIGLGTALLAGITCQANLGLARYLLALLIIGGGLTICWLFYWSDRAPVLKFSRAGLWARPLGFRPWSSVQVDIQRVGGAHRGRRGPYALRVYEANTGKLLEQWHMANLDVSIVELNGWLNHYSLVNTQ